MAFFDKLSRRLRNADGGFCILYGETGTLPVILRERQQLKNPKTPTFYKQNAPCRRRVFSDPSLRSG